VTVNMYFRNGGDMFSVFILIGLWNRFVTQTWQPLLYTRYQYACAFARWKKLACVLIWKRFKT